MPGAYFLDDIQIRDAISAAGLASVGLGSTGPEERQDAYERWLFPEPDDARYRASMADAMYSCGLNGLACLRASGVDAPELHEPYHTHVGAALSWLASIAQRLNAYVPLVGQKALDDAKPLRAGTILVVEGPVHVIVLCTDEDVPDGCLGAFTTSEGGQPEVGTRRDGTGVEHGMSIHSRTMVVRRVENRIQTGTLHEGGSITWGRLALYAIDPFYLVR